MKIRLSHLYLAAGVFVALGLFCLSGHKAFACTTCSFSAYPNQSSTPSSNPVTITNNTPLGGDSAIWTTSSVSYSTGSSGWLNINPPNGGPLAPKQSSTITLTVNTLSNPGTYYASFTINPSNGSISPQTINVTYTINSPCVINNFSASSGTSSSSPIPNDTSTTLNWGSSNCSSASITSNTGATVSNSTSLQGPGTTSNLTSTTTFTLTASGGGGYNPSATITVYVRGACTIPSNSFYPSSGASSSSPIPNNSSTTLNWSTSNCDTVSITGNNGATVSNSTSLQGPGTTSNLTSNTVFTINASQNGAGPGNSPTATTTVYVGAPCYIEVTSSYNNQPNTTPPGYSYTLSGPQVLGPSSTNQTWEVTPGNSWIISASTSATLTSPPMPSSTQPIYTPAQSQSCINPGDTITFNSAFYDLPNNPTWGSSPGGASGPAAYNTNTDSSVACGTILLSWGNGGNTSSYNLYKNTSNSQPGSVWQNVTSLTFTDSYPGVVPSSMYYYWIQAVNPYGVSAVVEFTPNTGISPTQCQADFSLSDKVVTQINNKNYAYNSTCIGNQSANAQTIANGDTASFSIDICNRGNLTATNIQVQDTLTNLTNPGNFKVNGSALGGAGNCGSNAPITICGDIINFNKNLPNIGPGSNDILTFDATVATPSGSSQQLQRFRNQAVFIYSTNGKTGPYNSGCVGQGDSSFSTGCNVDTGYIVFYNGSKSPIEHEVKP